jgi:hypothetical protein
MPECDETEWRYLLFIVKQLRKGDERYRQIFKDTISRVLYVNPRRTWRVLKFGRSSMVPVEVTEE